MEVIEISFNRDSFVPYSYLCETNILAWFNCHHAYVSITEQNGTTHYLTCGEGCHTNGTRIDHVHQNNQMITTPVFGNFTYAQLIAGHLPTSLCGITFGVNGTCHQRANRILWCCEGHPVLGDEVPGWRFSYGLYGNYGVDWDEYKKRVL